MASAQGAGRMPSKVSMMIIWPPRHGHRCATARGYRRANLGEGGLTKLSSSAGILKAGSRPTKRIHELRNLDPSECSSNDSMSASLPFWCVRAALESTPPSCASKIHTHQHIALEIRCMPNISLRSLLDSVSRAWHDPELRAGGEANHVE